MIILMQLFAKIGNILEKVMGLQLCINFSDQEAIEVETLAEPCSEVFFDSYTQIYLIDHLTLWRTPRV